MLIFIGILFAVLVYEIMDLDQQFSSKDAPAFRTMIMMFNCGSIFLIFMVSWQFLLSIRATKIILKLIN